MTDKSIQTLRAEARRAAREGKSRRRAQRLAKEKRLEDLAVVVMTAVAERDQAVAVTEQRAGEALVAMTETEGLSLREAVEWCEEAVDLAAATRLRRTAQSEARRVALADPKPPETAPTI